MIAIVDYGAGNLRSIQRALEAAGAATMISGDPDEVMAADRVVLPGVGNAAAAMARLRSSGLADAVSHTATSGKPLLGVCLGMQLLYGDQEEGPTTGLGLLDGTVTALPATLKVPQMGWNKSEFQPGTPLEAAAPTYFYFVHSYIVNPTDRGEIAAETNYGIRFPSIVARDNVWGFQFHPEKSGKDGLRLIKTWVDWEP
jgi:glutamine amidotransferase